MALTSARSPTDGAGYFVLANLNQRQEDLVFDGDTWTSAYDWLCAIGLDRHQHGQGDDDGGEDGDEHAAGMVTEDAIR